MPIGSLALPSGTGTTATQTQPLPAGMMPLPMTTSLAMTGSQPASSGDTRISSVPLTTTPTTSPLTSGVLRGGTQPISGITGQPINRLQPTPTSPSAPPSGTSTPTAPLQTEWAGTGSPIAQAVANINQSGINFPNLLSMLYNPNVNVGGPGVSSATPAQGFPPELLSLIAQMSGNTPGDFGIDPKTKEALKTSAAQGVNSQYMPMREQLMREYAAKGLLNDASSENIDRELDQQRRNEINSATTKIDTESGVNAMNQFLQNRGLLGQTVSGLANLQEQGRQNNMNKTLQEEQLNEGGRQFNVGAQMDLGRLSGSQGQLLSNAAQQNEALVQSIAQFLQELTLKRQQTAGGLVAEAPKIAGASLDNIRTAMGLPLTSSISF
jgi:hypothetical protein